MTISKCLTSKEQEQILTQLEKACSEGDAEIYYTPSHLIQEVKRAGGRYLDKKPVVEFLDTMVDRCPGMRRVKIVTSTAYRYDKD